MDDNDKTPPYGVGALGVVQLLKDKATIPDETPTGEYCPKCAAVNEMGVMTPGDGVYRYEDEGGYHHAVQCDLCEGNTWCTASDATDWRIRNIANGILVRIVPPHENE